MTWMPIAATLVIASIAVLLLDRPRDVDPIPPSGPDLMLPPDAGTAPAGGSGTPGGASPGTGQPAGDLSTRRTAGTREVGSKTFRLVAGEWVDASYDPNSVLPVVEVSGADRRELLERIPALTPYADIGDRVTVVYEGTVYRISR